MSRHINAIHGKVQVAIQNKSPPGRDDDNIGQENCSLCSREIGTGRIQSCSLCYKIEHIECAKGVKNSNESYTCPSCVLPALLCDNEPSVSTEELVVGILDQQIDVALSEPKDVNDENLLKECTVSETLISTPQDISTLQTEIHKLERLSLIHI